MPSARSILLQSSKNHLAILRLIIATFKFEAKFVNLTRRDPHLENAKFNSIKIYKTLNVLLRLQLRAAGGLEPHRATVATAREAKQSLFLPQRKKKKLKFYKFKL
nr:hypothetical protein [uncultured Campylobacter sp.]